jgi:hypothetical protein
VHIRVVPSIVLVNIFVGAYYSGPINYVGAYCIFMISFHVILFVRIMISFFKFNLYMSGPLSHS